MRAEERNKQTARLFDELGLFEYEGIEVFCDLKNLYNFAKFWEKKKKFYFKNILNWIIFK